MTPEERKAFKERMKQLKAYREQNPGKGYWDFKQQQAPGPYSAGELVKSIEEFTNHEEYLGPPSHNYDFTLSEEWADKHGYYPDERGHRDDIVKKEAHPTHPSKGKWKSQYQFDLTDKGIEDPNFILYGLNDGGQDPQATMTYRGGIVLPELTVTPKGNYIYNSYDNIKVYWPGGETGDDYDPEKELKRSLNIVEHMLKHKKPLTDDWKVINDYADKVLWTMENPNNNAYRDGKYYVYQDRGNDGVNRKNIGPGIESHSSIGQKLDYNGKTGYTREYLNGIVQEDLLKGTARIVESLNNMQDGKYYGVWDTLSVGPKMTLYDIYHNVKNKNKKNLPESWPKLIESIATGDLEKAKEETYSGSTRRQKMRNELLKYGDIDGVNNYADGGQTGDEPGSASLEQIEQREWLRNWLSNRTAQMADNIDTYANQVYYGSSHDRNHVLPFFFQNKEKNAANVIQEQLQWADETPVYDYREPWTVNLGNPYEDYFFGLPATLQGAFLKEPGKERAINISPITKDRSAILHELSHATQDKYEIQTSKIAEILKKHGKELPTHDKYYDNPNEIYSRMNQFRHDNGLKPSDVVTEEQIEQWKKSSIDNRFIKRYSTNTLLDLLNTVADANSRSRSDEVPMAKDGLQTGNGTPVIGTTTYNNYGDITHNIATSFSDDTLNLGLPDVVVTPRDNLDLAGYVNNRMNNAARFGADIMDWTTPVGDVHQLYDVVSDARSGDYLSAGIGLAALALPFTPTGLKHVKSQFKYIPSVNKSNVAQQIDAMADKAKQGYEYMTDVANAKNRVFESLKTMPYQYRAKKADEIYGTNYSEVYDVVDQLYNDDFFKLPEVLPKRMEARARMQAKPEAVKKFSKTGEGAGPEDFQLETNTELPMDPEQLSVHELNHYMDYIISRHPDASRNNRMLREMEKSLKKTGSSYFRMGTEQKAYMNQLRQILKKDGVIQNLDEPVSEATLKKYLDSMSDENSIKKAFKQHKNIKEYTKWFNSIPLAAVTAPVVNKGRTKESEDKLI